MTKTINTRYYMISFVLFFKIGKKMVGILLNKVILSSKETLYPFFWIQF